MWWLKIWLLFRNISERHWHESSLYLRLAPDQASPCILIVLLQHLHFHFHQMFVFQLQTARSLLQIIKKYIEWNLNDTHIKPQSHVLPNYMILLYKGKRMMITSFTSFCRSCTIFSALRIWLVRISTTTWRLFTSFSRYLMWDEGEFVCKRGWSRWETK